MTGVQTCALPIYRTGSGSGTGSDDPHQILGPAAAALLLLPQERAADGNSARHPEHAGARERA